MAPFVSVITVCRNAAPVIRQCIDSVNAQTCASIEHIIVDGASSDGTQRYIEESCQRSGSRVTHFISEADNGIYDAMNKSLKLARGSHVYFLNADDRFFSAESVATVTRVLAEKPVGLLQTRIALYDPSTGAGSLFAPPGGLRRTSPLYYGVYQQSIWAARTLFEQHGDFDSSFRYCGDVEWLMRVLKAGATCATSDVLSTIFLLGGASSNYQAEKKEQRRAELRHYSRLEWTLRKIARRASRPIEALALSLQT
jgi:GT2 family glycosyltransferase